MVLCEPDRFLAILGADAAGLAAAEAAHRLGEEAVRVARHGVRPVWGRSNAGELRQEGWHLEIDVRDGQQHHDELMRVRLALCRWEPSGEGSLVTHPGVQALLHLGPIVQVGGVFGPRILYNSEGGGDACCEWDILSVEPAALVLWTGISPLALF